MDDAEETRSRPRGEPRWLDPEEQTAWIGLVSVMIHLPEALDEQLRRDAGISHFEYLVMAVLSEQPDRAMRLSELGEAANASLTKLSRAVDRLAAQGWIGRAPDPTSRRSTLARLTDAGRDKVAATAPGHVEQVRRLVFDPLTRAQVRQLSGIGARLQHSLGHPAPTTGDRTPSGG